MFAFVCALTIIFLVKAVQSIAPQKSNVIIPLNVTVKAPNAARLQCRTRQNPVIQPTINDWLKDGKPLDADGVRTGRFTSSMGQLVIMNTRQEDSGTYTCILRNTAGTFNVSANVTVEGAKFMHIFQLRLRLPVTKSIF